MTSDVPSELPAEGTDTAMSAMADRLAIRDLLDNWVVWRDAGDWDRFASCWHPDGRMIATWFQAGAAEFIAGCRRAFEAGSVGLHFLGGSSIEVHGARAFAQTKMQITQRGIVHGVAVDVTCHGRFFDAVERCERRWTILHRQPVYELDAMTVVDPGSTIRLDDALLTSFPVGYRHLAYLQTQMGFVIRRDLPGTRGPEVVALDASLRRWLATGDRAALSAA